MMPTTTADRAQLDAHGWRLVPPLEMSLDVFGAYPEYIRRSRAEFTVAKDQNVRLRSGWFSERDACYLASGKPVVAQDTGFGGALPTGDGLFAARTIDDAAAAARRSTPTTRPTAARPAASPRSTSRRAAVARRLLRDIGLAA